jgi:hypothetical protein
MSEVEELLDENARLRNVYDSARRVLRFIGVDKPRADDALGELDAAIESVNLFYSRLHDDGRK